MKLIIILAIFLLFISGCSLQNSTKILGTQELILNEQELQQLGMTSDINESDIQLFGLSNGTNCRTEENYTNIVDSSSGQYSICVYNIPSLNNTQIIIQLEKFANLEALNGAYQYDSSHLYSIEGIISENDYGDKSKFRVNNVNDYGGQYDNPGVYYYHLWIVKNKYLIHITSNGDKEAKDYIIKIGQLILLKFE